MSTLSDRREELCLKFAIQAQKSEKYAKWFCENDSSGVNTRIEKPTFKPVQARLKRFEKSPLFYLTNLLNIKK